MPPNPRSAKCRLHLLFARSADIAVVLRRGPSKWFHLTLWNTRKDTFEPGGWFCGRIYEGRCDLSPNGKLFVYSALKGATSDDFPMNFTAICRPPWFTALTAWDRSAWAGGGIFETDHRLWLYQWEGCSIVKPGILPKELYTITKDGLPGDDFPGCPDRLGLNGWIPQWDVSLDAQEMGLIRELGRVKRCRTSSMSLAMQGEYYGYCKFTLRRGSAEIPLIGVDAADFDQNGRLIFARDGKVFSGSLNKAAILEETLLYDFNTLKPERTVAPDWARHWW